MYAVYVESEDGAYEFFGPFRSRDRAEAVWHRITEADDGRAGVSASIGQLQRPTATNLKLWIMEPEA